MQSDRRLETDGVGRFATLANLVFVVIALFFLLLFIHLFLVYNFNSPPTVPRYYYLIATLGVVLPILALKLSGKTKIKFALLITSTVFALYLSEFALFLLTPEYNLVAARREGVPFDARTRLEVVEDLRAQGVDAYPSAAAAFDPDDGGLYSLGGVSGKTTVMWNLCCL